MSGRDQAVGGSRSTMLRSSLDFILSDKEGYSRISLLLLESIQGVNILVSGSKSDTVLDYCAMHPVDVSLRFFRITHSGIWWKECLVTEFSSSDLHFGYIPGMCE